MKYYANKQPGALIIFNIAKVVIGENINDQGAEDYLKTRGVEVVVLNNHECIKMLRDLDEQNPGVWNKGD